MVMVEKKALVQVAMLRIRSDSTVFAIKSELFAFTTSEFCHVNRSGAVELKKPGSLF